MSKSISAQVSGELDCRCCRETQYGCRTDPSVCNIETVEMPQSASESTFTRHSKSIHAIIKEIMLGIITMLQLYLTFKISLQK